MGFASFFKRRNKRPDTDVETGRAGEDAAVDWLRRRGCEIVERNWTCPLGEVDVIARDHGAVVFVEVKTSRRKGSVPPEGRVRADKQRKLRSLAQFYFKHRGVDAPCRFDVISVWWENNERRIRHIENAF